MNIGCFFCDYGKVETQYYKEVVHHKGKKGYFDARQNVCLKCGRVNPNKPIMTLNNAARKKVKQQIEKDIQDEIKRDE